MKKKKPLNIKPVGIQSEDLVIVEYDKRLPKTFTENTLILPTYKQTPEITRESINNEETQKIYNTVIVIDI